MSKNISLSEAKRSLLSKGFEQKEGASHTQYVYFMQNRKKTSIRVTISRTKKREIDGNLMVYIKQQLCLPTLSDAHDLLKCPMSQGVYEQKLIENGVLTD